MRVCDSHISSQVSMYISPTEEGQIHHHHHHHRRRLPPTALLNRHRHHHPHQQDN